jgi:hypothetical protein
MLKDELILIFSQNKAPHLICSSLSKEIKKQIEEHCEKLPLKTKLITEKIYWIINELTEYPSECNCSYCGNIIYTKFKSLKDGYNSVKKYCSKKCICNSEEVRKKREKTNFEKYGHINNMWGYGIREQTKLKWIEKFDCDNPMKNEEIKHKMYNSNIEKIGVKMPAQNAECRKKAQNTCMERYGVDNAFKKDTAKKTCMKKFGFENPMQHPDIYNKANFYKRKIGFFPSGNEYIFQGYENIAIEELLYNGILETQIIIGDAKKIPIIQYFNEQKQKMSNYFPDIFIPHQNLLIEVKSEYTFKKEYGITIAKHLASNRTHLSHEIWVCSDKKIISKIKL